MPGLSLRTECEKNCKRSRIGSRAEAEFQLTRCSGNRMRFSPARRDLLGEPAGCLMVGVPGHQRRPLTALLGTESAPLAKAAARGKLRRRRNVAFDRLQTVIVAVDPRQARKQSLCVGVQ